MDQKVYLILERNSEYTEFDIFHHENVFNSEDAAIKSVTDQFNMDDMLLLKKKEGIYTYVFITYKKWHSEEDLKELTIDFEVNPADVCYYTIRKVKSFVIAEETVK